MSSTSPVGLSVPYRTPDTPPSQNTAVSVRTAPNDIQGPSSRSRNSTDAARLPGLVGSDAPDRRQRERAAADHRTIGLVGGCVPQFSAAPIARVVWTRLEDDEEEDHPADEKPQRPFSKDVARASREPHVHPPPATSTEVTCVASDVPQPRLVRRLPAGPALSSSRNSSPTLWLPCWTERNAGMSSSVASLVELIARPFALTTCGSARWREATAPVETLGTLVVVMGPEVNPRAGPPLGLGERRVQDDAADSLAPPLGNDEEVAEEPTAGDDRTSPALATQRLGGRHPDDRRAVGRHEQP